jgi:signal transduction histidine kinase
VNVELEYQPEHLSLAVSDDGRGLNGGNAEPEEEQIKTGIRNMQDRASRIGADLQFTTFTGGGTRIFIDLPLK